MALLPSATGRGEGKNAVNIDKLTFFSSSGTDPIAICSQRVQMLVVMASPGGLT